MISLLLAAATAAALPPPSWVGFPFREAAAEVGPPSVEVLFKAPGSSAIDEIAVFQEADGTGPRWRLIGAGRGSRARLLGSPERRSVALFRVRGQPFYLMDGPFRWPLDSAEREPTPVHRRTVSGGLPPKAETPHVLPEADGSFCESGQGRWSCAGVRADRKGVIVVAAGESDRRTILWTDIPASGSVGLTLHPAAWVAYVRLTSEPLPSGVPTVTLQKPGPAGGVLLIPDQAIETRFFAPDLLLLFGRDSPDGRVATFRWGSLSARSDVDSLVPPGVPEISIPLPLHPPIALAGTIRDPDGAPLVSALYLLLERSPSKLPGGKLAERTIADGETDRLGRWEASDVPPGIYRLRACEGTLGCAERDVATDTNDGDLVIRPTALFRGRVVARGGVPEPGAWIRITPTLGEFVASDDRIRRTPLMTRADEQGRFRIAASAKGRWVLEAKSEHGGVARREVDAGEISPDATDVGDLVLSVPGQFDAVVKGCGGGELTLTGPMGGETMLPSSLRFPLDAGGRARVEVPESGTWLAGAVCGGARRAVEPMLLNEVRDLFGTEVAFVLGAPDAGEH